MRIGRKGMTRSRRSIKVRQDEAKMQLAIGSNQPYSDMQSNNGWCVECPRSSWFPGHRFCDDIIMLQVHCWRVHWYLNTEAARRTPAIASLMPVWGMQGKRINSYYRVHPCWCTYSCKPEPTNSSLGSEGVTLP